LEKSDNVAVVRLDVKWSDPGNFDASQKVKDIQSWRIQSGTSSVRSGCYLDLSLHHHRSEHWVMVTGTACVHVGEDDILRFDDDYGRV
jgi:mannose-6-phosphate isomerase-like protein (cupin superfamily)